MEGAAEEAAAAAARVTEVAEGGVQSEATKAMEAMTAFKQEVMKDMAELKEKLSVVQDSLKRTELALAHEGIQAKKFKEEQEIEIEELRKQIENN